MRFGIPQWHDGEDAANDTRDAIEGKWTIRLRRQEKTDAMMAAYSEFFPSPEIWFKFIKTCQIGDADSRRACPAGAALYSFGNANITNKKQGDPNRWV